MAATVMSGLALVGLVALAVAVWQQGRVIGDLRRWENAHERVHDHQWAKVLNMKDRVQSLEGWRDNLTLPSPETVSRPDQTVEILGRVLDNLTRPPEFPKDAGAAAAGGMSQAQFMDEVARTLGMHLDPTDGIPSVAMPTPMSTRSMVGGLAPGQSIPGIDDPYGQDSWVAEWEQSEAKVLGVTYEEWLGERFNAEPGPMGADEVDDVMRQVMEETRDAESWVPMRGFDE